MQATRVTFGRDRFVGIEAGSELGIFATREISFTGRRLTVNVEPTGAEAALRVQVVRGDTTPPAGFLSALKIVDHEEVSGFRRQVMPAG